MDADGTNVISLTANNPEINQRHNGNPAWHPSGKYIVFQSEEMIHYGVTNKWISNPGIGIFNNLWVVTSDGSQYWKLTDIDIKQSLEDRIPVMGVLNPHFSHDGSKLVWTERYGEGGKWGRWRIKIADFIDNGGKPYLDNERILLQPDAYVTAMAFSPDDTKLLLSGNLDKQDEYGMDQYIFDIRTGELVNLLNMPQWWEEGSSWSPDGKYIVYMTNIGSPLNFSDPKWYLQPRTREYWIMNSDGSNKRQLTHFNEPGFPEYIGRRVIVADPSFGPDGTKIAGIIGIDYGTEDRADIKLKIVVIELF